MTATRRFYVGVAAVLVVLLLTFLWRQRGGIEVSVENDETFTLRDVEVHTTAGTYPLGELRPGDSASTLVGAKGESSILASWRDAQGARHEHDADVYFEGAPTGTSMYGGYVDFTIGAGAARVEKSVGPRFHVLSRGTPPQAK